MTNRTVRPILALSALATLVSACATTPSGEGPAGEGGSAPAPVAGYDWFLNDHDGSVQLVYGQAESDDVRLSLVCEGGREARLEVAAHAAQARPAEIHLESGGETERFQAEAEPYGVGDGYWLTAIAPTTQPVFQRFRQTRWIAQWEGHDRHVYAAHPDSGDRIETFFSRCG